MSPSNPNDETLFFEDTISPSDTLFPADLLDPSALLNIPQPTSGKQQQRTHQHIHHSPSISTMSDNSTSSLLSPLSYSLQQHQQQQQIGGYSISSSSGSRLPSLSPSTQSINLSSSNMSLSSNSNNGQSPRSYSSPGSSSNSNFSLLATDDFLFNGNSNNSFDSTELDILFQSEDSKDLLISDNQNQNQFFNSDNTSEFIPQQNKSNLDGQGQSSLFLPNQQSNPFLLDNNGNLDFLQNLFNGNMNNSFGDDTFDMLNLESPITTLNNGKRAPITNGSFPIDFDFAQQAKAIGNMSQPHSQQQQQSQWVKQEQNNLPNQQDQVQWPLGNVNGMQDNSPNSEQINSLGYGLVENGPFSFNQPLSTTSAPKAKSNVKAPRQTKKDKAAPVPKAVADAPSIEGEPPVVGKHNKTERRYRQKVQAAQADLRDAIPALRLLYGTSTEEQKLSTDFRAADGTVDGLGEVTRPNASAKATILIGARMYIELLQKRSAMLQRKVNELEAFRLAVAGEEDLRRWQADFNSRESQIQAAADAIAAAKAEEDSLDDDDDDEEEEEEQPKRKRTKTAAVPKQPRGKPGPKKKDQTSTIAQNAADGGLRMFAAFAVSFSFLPSASTILKQTPTQTSTNGQVLPSEIIGQATTGQILSKLPLITAEHTSRLLARGLPQAIVPAPHTLVDWTWRLLVAIILAVSMGPIIARWSKVDDKKKAGKLSILAKDCAKLVVPNVDKTKKADDDSMYWNKMAAGIVGRTIKPSTIERWHVMVHLHNTASDAHSLTLLALLQHDVPFLRSAQQVWREAQAKLTSSTPLPLATVLKLPLHEALRCAESIPSTLSPITAIAEQITLVHVYDLYTRFFVKLVDASTRSSTTGSASASLKNLLFNLETCNIGTSLKSSAFDKEIREVIEGLPKGSAAHALGLVLIGLWGIFVKPTPNAQAALASALAAEEVQGAGKGLSSISSLLELLYPGSKDILATHGLNKSSNESNLPKNALVVDKLALTCIEYIKLLISSNEVNDPELSRMQRLEASKKIQKGTAHLRLVLTQTKFIGFEDHHPHHQFSDNDEYEEDDDLDGEEQAQDDDTVQGDSNKKGYQDLENEVKKFELAKETLVKVLCNVSRVASGRINGRDEDSGLEGDLDDL